MLEDDDVGVGVAVTELISEMTDIDGSRSGLLQDKGIVLVPTTNADVPSDIGVPETVMPGPPGEMVLPSIARPLCVAVKTSPSTVKIEALGGRVTVLVPMMRSEDPRETGVPEIVTPDPPGVSVVPAIEKPVGFAVKLCPATVKMDGEGEVGGNVIVVDTGVPETVTPGPPGVSVVPAIENPVGIAVKL